VANQAPAVFALLSVATVVLPTLTASLSYAVEPVSWVVRYVQNFSVAAAPAGPRRAPAGQAGHEEQNR